MNMQNILPSLFLPSLLALLASGTVLAAPLDETREMDAGGRVSIEMINGRVSIRSWERNEFRIAGELSDRASGFDLENHGGNISFEEEYSEHSGSCWFGFGEDCNRARDQGSEYEIFMPATATLNVEGVNVHVDVADIEGGVNIDLVNGNIKAYDLSGRIDLETVNGGIESGRLQGGRVEFSTVNGAIRDRGSRAERASLETVNGSIESDIVSPRLEVESVNGSIELETGAVDELDAATVNGTMTLTLSFNPGADVGVSTVGGDVRLVLPADSSARFEISTNSGTVRNNLSGHEVQSRGAFGREKELNFSLNGGSARVDISSFSGNVRLEPR